MTSSRVFFLFGDRFPSIASTSPHSFTAPISACVGHHASANCVGHVIRAAQLASLGHAGSVACCRCYLPHRFPTPFLSQQLICRGPTGRRLTCSAGQSNRVLEYSFFADPYDIRHSAQASPFGSVASCIDCFFNKKKITT